jgi:hypothetical protein
MSDATSRQEKWITEAERQSDKIVNNAYDTVVNRDFFSEAISPEKQKERWVAERLDPKLMMETYMSEQARYGVFEAMKRMLARDKKWFSN